MLHAFNAYEEVTVHLRAVLTSALDVGEGSASRPGHFTASKTDRYLLTAIWFTPSGSVKVQYIQSSTHT